MYKSILGGVVMGLPPAAERLGFISRAVGNLAIQRFAPAVINSSRNVLESHKYIGQYLFKIERFGRDGYNHPGKGSARTVHPEAGPAHIRATSLPLSVPR